MNVKSKEVELEYKNYEFVMMNVKSKEVDLELKTKN